MSEPFETVREFEVEAPPEDVFAAVTTGTAGRLFPLEYEPREGGAASGGATVTVRDPPHRVTALRAARALGLPPGAAEVEADLPGAGPTAAVLDYRSPYFIGLRTADAMYRFFGRNHWGATVGVAVHAFAPGADAAKATAEAADWPARAYA